MRIINFTKQIVIAEYAQKADTAFSRIKGLLGRDRLVESEGLIITHCRSIHMFFMKFPIDVLFVNRANVVIGCVKRIRPFQMSPYFFRSSYVVELPQGKIDQTRTEKGDVLVLEE